MTTWFTPEQRAEAQKLRDEALEEGRAKRKEIVAGIMADVERRANPIVIGTPIARRQAPELAVAVLMGRKPEPKPARREPDHDEVEKAVEWLNANVPTDKLKDLHTTAWFARQDRGTQHVLYAALAELDIAAEASEPAEHDEGGDEGGDSYYDDHDWGDDA